MTVTIDPKTNRVIGFNIGDLREKAALRDINIMGRVAVDADRDDIGRATKTVGDTVMEIFVAREENFILEVTCSQNRQVSSLSSYSATLAVQIPAEPLRGIRTVEGIHGISEGWRDQADFAHDLFEQVKRRSQIDNGLELNLAQDPRFKDLANSIARMERGCLSISDQQRAWEDFKCDFLRGM